MSHDLYDSAVTEKAGEGGNFTPNDCANYWHFLAPENDPIEIQTSRKYIYFVFVHIRLETEPRNTRF